MHMGKIKIGTSFLVLVILTFVIDSGHRYLFLLTASCLHELCHAAAIRLLGGSIKQIRLIPGGLDICYTERHTSYLADFVIAASGPLGNLGAALCFSSFNHHQAAYFVGINLILCFFNLLPLYPLDGGRVLYSVMTYFSPLYGGRNFFLISAALSFLLFAASVGACFYNIRAFWSVFVFGYILCNQKMDCFYRDGV